MKNIVAVLLGLLIGGCAASASAAVCTLEWNANTETDLAGYRVYHSLESRLYAGSVQSTVTPTTTCDALAIVADDRTHYFTVTAYDTSNNESPKSNEAAVFLAVPPPPPPPPPIVCLRYNKRGKCIQWGN